MKTKLLSLILFTISCTAQDIGNHLTHKVFQNQSGDIIFSISTTASMVSNPNPTLHTSNAPTAILSETCKCLKIFIANRKQILISISQRSDDITEALGTLIVSIAADYNYSDWREYLIDKKR